MIKAPSNEQREALARLQFSRDGKEMLTYLQEAFAEAQTRCMVDDDPHRVRAYQGVSRALRGLIDLLNPVSQK